MSSFKSNGCHLQDLLIYFFNLKKSAAEAHRLLVESYGGSTLTHKCTHWIQP
ncbi:Mariner Mos1 transposase, partial [Stegodyphus mimosarum]